MSRNMIHWMALVTLFTGAVALSMAQQTAESPGTGAATATATASDRPEPTLSGARPTIDASEYKNLHQALAAVPEEGAKVTIPAGHYEIDKPLVVDKDQTTLQGAGDATLIENTSDSGKPTLIVSHPNAESEQTDLERVRLADFRLVGGDQSGHGIVARRVDFLYIDGVTVTEHGGDGIMMDHCYENPRLVHNLITNNKQTGLRLLGCHDIVVADNEFEANDTGVGCVDSYNLTMSGNNLDDHKGPGIVIENTYGSVVSGNMIEECNANAMILDRDCYGITLASNVIAHNGAGIDLKDAHGCAVSSNTFTINKRTSLHIRPASGRITVSGNNFSDSYARTEEGPYVRKEKDGTGIVLEGTQDITITGNTFSGLETPALRVAGGEPSKRVVFSGNVLRRNSGPSDLDQLVESKVVNNIISE